MELWLKTIELNTLFDATFSLVIFIGILGNLTNILVLKRISKKKSLSFKLFLYLSIIDLTFLTQTGMELMIKSLYGTEIRTTFSLCCKLTTFFSHFLLQTRNVYTMYTTINYVNEIKKLLPNSKHQTRVKTMKTHTSLVTILICLMLINIHFILFLDINYDTTEDSSQSKDNKTKYAMAECSASKDTFYAHFLRSIWVWIDMIVYFLVPFSVNLIAFFTIFFYIKRLNGHYATLLSNKNYKPNARIYMKRMRKNRRIVWRVFLLILYFFLSSTPAYIFYYSLILTRTDLFLNNLFYVLFYSNNALNFLFYGCTSQKYRCVLIRMAHGVFQSKLKSCCFCVCFRKPNQVKDEFSTTNKYYSQLKPCPSVSYDNLTKSIRINDTTIDDDELAVGKSNVTKSNVCFL
jgi:hypothetical protein